ncbi:MAG: AraC family transcriptional regulator ligand-binding domain-containing protein [Burkholderiales bacterium]|nr:AraC family transcriptional regulator ligand-binding domain-containing protein [Burkholderiales bacterium]
MMPTSVATDALRELHTLPPAGGYYTCEQRVLAWADQGLLLAGFARSRGLATADWLAGSGVQAGQALSCAELLRLLQPLLGLGRDAPFVLGQLWLPGHYGLASQALQSSGSLAEAAHILARLSGRLLPLMTLRPLRQGSRLWLVFTEACGLPAAQRAALVDLHLTALVGYGNWRAGRRLPWQICFNRTAPRELGMHATQLSPDLRFDCQVDALSLPLALAEQAWPADARGALAVQALPLLLDGADPQALCRGWLAGAQERMLAQLSEPGGASQERLAQQFGISLATLKRQFAQHGTHWQAELDLLRTRLALALLREPGWSPARVGEALGFVDPSNFRRSLRRWTGNALLDIRGM